MKKNNQVYLQEVLDAIAKIEQYTKGLSFIKFSKNTLVQDGVIRNLELIGEAIRHLTPDFIKKHSELPGREIVAMRNFLIHQYDEVNVEMLWETVKRDLPILKNQVSQFLSE